MTVRPHLGFSTYAVLDENGVWHSQGDMGWFGVSTETPEESSEWGKSYVERLFSGDPETWVVVVDCHI